MMTEPESWFCERWGLVLNMRCNSHFIKRSTDDSFANSSSTGCFELSGNFRFSQIHLSQQKTTLVV